MHLFKPFKFWHEDQIFCWDLFSLNILFQTQGRNDRIDAAAVNHRTFTGTNRSLKFRVAKELWYVLYCYKIISLSSVILFFQLNVMILLDLHFIWVCRYKIKCVPSIFQVLICFPRHWQLVLLFSFLGFSSYIIYQLTAWPLLCFTQYPFISHVSQ